MILIIKDNTYKLTTSKNVRALSPGGEIFPCTGCYQCWIRTPGICVIQDDYCRMASLLSEVDEIFLLSRMTYGSVSPFVKNVLDRSLSYMLPYFEVKDDHSHHPLRYPNRFRMHYAIYGEATEGEKETLRKIASANGKNLEAEVDVEFFTNWRELEEGMREHWID